MKLLYLAGIAPSLKTARDLGITTLTNPAQYGLTLVLGGGEVKLLEMVGAYGVFANEGVRNDLHSILRVEDSTGNILEEASSSPKKVLDRSVSLQISSVLSDNVARTPLYGANSPLYFPGHDVAAKTGTTNDKRDTWVIGYTPEIAVGAWAGNNNNSSMNEMSGLIITPLWRAFMDEALKKYTGGTFAEPPHTPSTAKPILRGVWFDPLALVSGEGSTTPSIDLKQAIASAHSILYYVNKDDPNGPQPTNPQNDPQFTLWEYPVSLWKAQLLSGTSSPLSSSPQQ